MPFLNHPAIIDNANYRNMTYATIFKYSGEYYLYNGGSISVERRSILDADGEPTGDVLETLYCYQYDTLYKATSNGYYYTWMPSSTKLTGVPFSDIELLYCSFDFKCYDYTVKPSITTVLHYKEEFDNFAHGFLYYWMDGDTFPVANTHIQPLGDQFVASETWSIDDGNGFPYKDHTPPLGEQFVMDYTWLIKNGYTFPYHKDGPPIFLSKPLTSRKAYVLVEESTDLSASMFFDDKWYKFIDFIDVFPVYTGTADEGITHHYGGTPYYKNGTPYYFLASGIEMLGMKGGYGGYSDEIIRTVNLNNYMSANVNFYYTSEKPKSNKIILKGISTLQSALQTFDGTTIEEISATIKSICKFLARSKRVSIEPVKFEAQLEPGDEIIIDSNFMIAIKNGTENVSNQLLGRFPMLQAGENIIIYTDNEVERNIELTIEQKDRWH
ncbi:hypothetical protein P9E76_15500 [Schinkia azotoformans]|uniref:Uncharacterized protein n=1 Tax=Schinkia azotoformans LMG 9581 TaxID=1131731 RepID=K6DIG2_SCHAZ|nr:hypothetical protein [Schinkia azotoformans]EKN68079.1 hypothetical protein BAZO_06164 [Schinkia azotoformans LMG 9581]MEC1638116.1 hypothetical protein [Schinkia azotoformans]MEC1946450.1 hypothetical protein [Schinkia azotoformans]